MIRRALCLAVAALAACASTTESSPPPAAHGSCVRPDTILDVIRDGVRIVLVAWYTDTACVRAGGR